MISLNHVPVMNHKSTAFRASLNVKAKKVIGFIMMARKVSSLIKITGKK